MCQIRRSYIHKPDTEDIRLPYSSSNFKMFSLGILLLLSVLPGTITQNVGTGPLPHTMVVDPDEKFLVSWDFNDTHITFELRVRTLGYVGIGVSPNGGMPGSAITTGWVDDESGETVLTDRFAEGRFEPMPTEQQDSVLISSYQNDTHTVIRFTRRLILCGLSSGQIKTDTVRLIWAYHDQDPPTKTGLRYHGPNRGTRSVFLLDPHKKKPEMPADAITFDFLNRKAPLSDDQTFYWCESFEVPKLDRKHHVIKFEPIIDRKSETHHMILYSCFDKVQNSSINVGTACYTANMPTDWYACRSVMVGWAVGGPSFYLPEHVGMPVGHEGGPTLFMLETHYDNPRRQKGLVDSSGFRVTMTPTLRRYDGGVLRVGSAVTDRMVIPPFSESFRSDGHCTKECLEQGMDGHQEEIKMYASLLHTHLAGRRVRVRHFRHGIEQEVLSKDDNYDFNLQEVRLFEKELTVRKGDNIVTECYFNTMDRENITYGGPSTYDEMCIGFMVYYPSMPLSTCGSSPHVPYLLDFLGVKLDARNRVVSPERLRGQMWNEVLQKEVDWTDPSERKRFEEWVNAREVEGAVIQCRGAGVRYPLHGTVGSFPPVLWELPETPPKDCPSVSQAHKQHPGTWTILALALAGLMASAARL